MTKLADKEGILKRLINGSITVGDCKLWQGPFYHREGSYGQIGIGNKYYAVHRVAAHLFLDFDLDSPLYVLHKCRNKNCWSCIYIGTQSDNVQDAIREGTWSNGRKEQTHCKNGHLLTGDNAYKFGHKRMCKVCRAVAAKRLRDKVKLRKLNARKQTAESQVGKSP